MTRFLLFRACGIARAATIGLVFAILPASGPLRAGNAWTFCSSADYASRQAYLTDAFRAEWPRADLEQWFAHTLEAHRVAPTGIQCPSPGDHEQVAIDQARTDEFLRELGFTITHVHPTHGKGV